MVGLTVKASKGDARSIFCECGRLKLPCSGGMTCICPLSGIGPPLWDDHGKPVTVARLAKAAADGRLFWADGVSTKPVTAEMLRGTGIQVKG